MKRIRSLILALMLATSACATTNPGYVPKEFSTDGSDTTFTVTEWPIIDTSDVVVTYTNSAGTVTTLSETTHYTVTRVGNTWDSGFTVTTVAAYATGGKIMVSRATPQDQDRTTSAMARPVQIAGAADKLTRLVQELQEQLGRSLHVGVQASGVDMNLPADFESSEGYAYWNHATGEWSLASTVSSGVSATPWGETWITYNNSYEAREGLDAQKRHWFDVTESPYLATGDGATDDTAAIQACENDADDTGGTVYFPPGRYLVSDTLEMNDVSVFGDGTGSVTIVMASDVDKPVFRFDEATGITVRGISVTGQQVQNAGFDGSAEENYAGIKLESCTNAIVTDCNFADLTQGVWAYGTHNFVVQRCRFIGCFDPNSTAGSNYNYSAAIRVGLGAQCTDGSISDNYIFNWSAGITVSSIGLRINMERNIIRFCAENGIYVSSGHDCLSQGNYIESVCGVGIKHRGNGHRIIGNKVYDAGFAAGGTGQGGGVRITGLDDATTDFGNGVIADNVIDGTVSYGILVGTYGRKFENFTISGNSLNDCGDPCLVDNYGMGIMIPSGCSHGVVANNVIRNDNASRLHGAMAIMGLLDGSKDVNDITVIGNQFIDCNNGAVICQYTNDIKFIGNSFYEVPDQAVRWKEAGSNKNWLVADNDGNNISAGGTVMFYAEANSLSNSRFINNRGVGQWTTITNFVIDDEATNWNWINDPNDMTTIKGGLKLTGDLVPERTTIAANDTTPTVGGTVVCKTANTAPTTISDFDDPNDGQIIVVRVDDSNTTFDFSASSLIGNGGVDYTATDGDSLMFTYDSVETKWYLVAINGAGPTTAATPYEKTLTLDFDGSWDNEAWALPLQAPDGRAVTIKKIKAYAIGSGTPTLTFNLEERAEGTINSTGTDIFASSQTATAAGIEVTSFSNASIAAGAHFWWKTGAAAASGTVDAVKITIIAE